MNLTSIPITLINKIKASGVVCLPNWVKKTNSANGYHDNACSEKLSVKTGVRHEPNEHKINLFPQEFPENFEPKLPLVLVLDVSSSMRGKGINELNNCLQLFESTIKNTSGLNERLEICIVSFGNDVIIERDFSLLGNTSLPILKAGGKSRMIDGIEVAIKLVDKRKEWFRGHGLQYFMPYIILITDGAPWPEKYTGSISGKIKDNVEGRKFIFQAFGAGNANMGILNSISHREYPPNHIGDYDFGQLFQWLIPSISKAIFR